MKVIRYGAVVFYQPNYSDKTIKEINRTKIVSFSEALDIYCETPNPVSQIVKGETEAEVAEELKKLEVRIHGRDWLDELFECI